MNLGKILKGVAVVAGPVVGGLVAGPAGAGLVVTGMGAAGLTKKAGQAREKKTGRPVHKVASPLVGMAIPALVAQFLSPEQMMQICDVAVRLCETPAMFAGIGAGVLGLVAHTLGGGAQQAVDGRNK